LVARAALYVALIAPTVIFTFPLLWMFSTSLKTQDEAFQWPPSLIPSQLMWSNYIEGAAKFPLLRSTLNTVMIILWVEIGRLLSASLTAYAFARLRFRGRDVLFLVVLALMMVPYHVTLIPQFIIFRSFGWVNSPLPLIVPAFFGGGSFFIFLLRQFFMTIPLELDDAARIDGCGVFGIYRHILMPLAKPALATVAIFTFIGE